MYRCYNGYYNGLYILTYIGDYIGLYLGYVSHKPMLTYMIWCLKKSAIMRIRIPLKPPVRWEACSLGVWSLLNGEKTTSLDLTPDIATPVNWEGIWINTPPQKKYLKTQTILRRYVLDVRKSVFFFQIHSIFEGFFWASKWRCMAVFFSKSALFWKAFLGIEMKVYEEILGCPGTEVRINGS